VVVQPVTIPGHNASLAILGVFILWFGWYGFNPGSALAILGVGDVVALSAINTTLSAAGGTVSALLSLMVLEFMDSGHIMWDLIGASNGTLGGLVGITSACSVAEVRSEMPVDHAPSWKNPPTRCARSSMGAGGNTECLLQPNTECLCSLGVP
jgi:ammonia channel protein AmtB